MTDEPTIGINSIAEVAEDRFEAVFSPLPLMSHADLVELVSIVMQITLSGKDGRELFARMSHSLQTQFKVLRA